MVDMDLVKQVLTHPEIYPRITEDGAPPREEYNPPGKAIFVGGFLGDEIIGLMIYHKDTAVVWGCHVQVLPDYRDYAFDFGKQALDWLKEMTNAKKVTAQIPVLYPDVIRFAEKHGFKNEGTNKQSYLKNGQLTDKVYLGKMLWDT